MFYAIPILFKDLKNKNHLLNFISKVMNQTKNIEKQFFIIYLLILILPPFITN